MIRFSNCKLNVGLYITGKRTDGYHNIETIFYPIPVSDVLELTESEQTEISILGLPIPGNSENNIVLKSWHLLKKDFNNLPPVHFHLLKNIPIGAGLGAGSANGAYALKALNEKYQLNLSTNELIDYALQLGSDCPFFILNEPAFAAGRGEILEKVQVDLSGYQIIIVNPGIHISTPWAFKQLTPTTPVHDLQKSLQKPISEWKEYIFNDFERVVFKAYPEIAAIKSQLYQAGAVFAAMSGSGSTVYGLFEKDINVNLNLFSNYFTKKIIL